MLRAPTALVPLFVQSQDELIASSAAGSAGLCARVRVRAFGRVCAEVSSFPLHAVHGCRWEVPVVFDAILDALMNHCRRH